MNYVLSSCHKPLWFVVFDKFWYIYKFKIGCQVRLLYDKLINYTNDIHISAFKRHGIRQLQCLLSSVPHMYNEITLEMFKREPNCTEVILHPLLRVLEVNAKTLPMVLENGYNLNKLTTLYLFFDINRCVALVPQFLSFVGSLSYLTHLKVCNC